MIRARFAFALALLASCTPRESRTEGSAVVLPPLTSASVGVTPSVSPNLVPLGDADRDGLRNEIDLCPTQPEDMDAFEDEDGCPDFDNDRDRIPDADDKCPNEPETYNGYEDEDGCPDKSTFIIGP